MEFKTSKHRVTLLCDSQARHSLTFCWAMLAADAGLKDFRNIGTPLLHYAINHGSFRCFEVLIAAGADVAVKDDQGRTALHTVAASENDNSQQQKAYVELLVAAGADVNAKDEAGQTPLLLGLSTPSAVITALLAAGADYNLCNEQGLRPLDVAVRDGRSWAAAELLVAGARLWDEEAKMYEDEARRVASNLAMQKQNLNMELQDLMSVGRNLGLLLLRAGVADAFRRKPTAAWAVVPERYATVDLFWRRPVQLSGDVKKMREDVVRLASRVTPSMKEAIVALAEAWASRAALKH